ncbi:MAG: polymerase sigma factor SigD [Pseudomonadota bacterium]
MSESLQAIEARLNALWRASQQGDSASYAQALTLLGAQLRRYLRKRLPAQSGDVEDLVQETLIAIHQKRHTYQSNQPLTAWVFAIARYKWIDHLRAHGRREQLHEPIDDWVETLTVEGEEHASDAQRDLPQLLAELPAKQRVAIEHTRLQGLSVAETAKLTGQSEASVKVNVHRGLKALVAKWGVQK